jgi:hypothetical protein
MHLSTTQQMPPIHDSRLARVQALQQDYSALQQDLLPLEERIALLRAVIADEVTSNDSGFDASLAQHQYDLSVALYVRFGHTREIGDLVEAEVNIRTVLAGLGALRTASPSPSSVLGSILRERGYEMLSHVLAEKALALHRQPFLDGPLLTDLERACYSRELGLTLRVCCAVGVYKEGYPAESVHQLKVAQALFAKTNVIDYACSAGLVHALVILYYVQKDRADLNEASVIGDLALLQCGPHHRDFYLVASAVSTTHHFLAWFNEDVPAIFKTLNILHTALADAPLAWATSLTIQLVDTLRLRFMKQGSTESLSEAAIRAVMHLNSLTSEAPRWDRLQASLAEVLLLRFKITGAAGDMEDAAHAAEQALSRSNIETPLYLTRLAHLAVCRENQYQEFRNLSRLNECIRLTDMITQLAPPHSVNWLTAKYDLLGALMLRIEAIGSLHDLNRAVGLVPDLSASSRCDRQEAHIMLRAVANVYLLRFERTNSPEDWERAITHMRKTVQVHINQLPQDLQRSHNVLHLYTKAMRTRYEIFYEMEQVTDALAQQNLAMYAPSTSQAVKIDITQTVACNDPGGDYVVMALNRLLDALSTAYCPELNKLIHTIDILTYVAKHAPRLNYGTAPKMVIMYSTAVSVLPEVASFGLDARTRLSATSNSGRLTTQEALHAISIGHIKVAIEKLEAGRSAFWTQGLHLRTPFTDLPPEIGDKLTNITSILNQPIPDSKEPLAQELEFARRRRLGDEFVAVLARARQLPGFQDLLEYHSFASIAQAARQHPIVIFVAGESTGYALIILENAQCTSVTLKTATTATLKTLSHRIEVHSRHVRSLRGMRKAQASDGVDPTDVYRELWVMVMLPVVDALGWPVSLEELQSVIASLIYVQKAQGWDRPRLTLCPTGGFMQLPLHAAGIYTGSDQIWCSDYFVSTYVPSIGALLHARQTFKPTRRVEANTLIVAVEHPFQGTALLSTLNEAGTVQSHVSPSAKVTQVSASADVFAGIQLASILHMACHGTQDLGDALQSGFFLEDELLPISKLMELELPRAFLAVLSACETAKGDASQPDQAIHLAATMLFMGFKSVVATMWYVFNTTWRRI